MQRNGLAVDLEEEPKLVEAQNQSESPDPAGGKSDKVYSQGKKKKKVDRKCDFTMTLLCLVLGRVGGSEPPDTSG